MFLSRRPTQPDRETEIAKQAIRSLINESHLVSETLWALSIVRKRETEHACLIIEGKRQNAYIIFRSDLFLVKREQPLSNPISSAIDFLFQQSQSLKGTAFIHLKEVSVEELERLAEASEFQSYGIEVSQAEKLLKRMIEEGNRTYTYHKAGDHSIYSASTSRSDHQNCISWCQMILREELQIEIGDKWALIKRPSEVVKQAIEQAKKSAASSSSASANALQEAAKPPL